jgi:hypothetical protein
MIHDDSVSNNGQKVHQISSAQERTHRSFGGDAGVFVLWIRSRFVAEIELLGVEPLQISSSVDFLSQYF